MKKIFRFYYVLFCITFSFFLHEEVYSHEATAISQSCCGLYKEDFESTATLNSLIKLYTGEIYNKSTTNYHKHHSYGLHGTTNLLENLCMELMMVKTHKNKHSTKINVSNPDIKLR